MLQVKQCFEFLAFFIATRKKSYNLKYLNLSHYVSAYNIISQSDDRMTSLKIYDFE